MAPFESPQHTILRISFDNDDPKWHSLEQHGTTAFAIGCSCDKALRRFDPEQNIVTDGKFELRLLFKSEAFVNNAKAYYHAHLPAASNLAEYLPKIRGLFYELAGFCECKAKRQGNYSVKGSDTLRVADPEAHAWAAFPNEVGIRSHVNRAVARKIAKRVELSHNIQIHQSLGYVYILSCPSRNLVKIGYSNDHPQKRLSEISPCYPDAVLIAYTVQIPHPHRVEQLAHAELALQRQLHSCPVCGKTHREWFKASHGLAKSVVLRWAKWIAKQPYEDHSGELHPAWVKMLSKPFYSRLALAKEHPNPQDPGWGTWTAFHVSTRREDYSAQVDLNICHEKVSPFR